MQKVKEAKKKKVRKEITQDNNDRFYKNLKKIRINHRLKQDPTVGKHVEIF